MTSQTRRRQISISFTGAEFDAITARAKAARLNPTTYARARLLDTFAPSAPAATATAVSALDAKAFTALRETIIDALAEHRRDTRADLNRVAVEFEKGLRAVAARNDGDFQRFAERLRKAMESAP